MAWIETHQSLVTHRKTGRLMRALAVSRPTALGHLQCLWLWGLDNAPDGDLTGIDVEDLADGAYWEGDPTTFLAGLMLAGFVEQVGDRLVIHDWYDYAGKLVDARRANAERMRAKRATHVQRTFPARTGATVPNPTEHNTTQPEEAGEDPPPVPPAPTQEPPPRKTFPVSPSTAGFDFPGLWAGVEIALGYKPTWDYDREAETIKQLRHAHPRAGPPDFVRFLVYAATLFPWRDNPAEQVTFSGARTHFGKWFTGGQPATATEAQNGKSHPGQPHRPSALARLTGSA